MLLGGTVYGGTLATRGAPIDEVDLIGDTP